MKPQSILFTVVVPVLALSSCGQSKDESKPASKPESKSVDDTTEKKPSEMPTKAVSPDFSSWDQAGKTKAWQGSWVVKEEDTVEAWTVTGDKVQTWDGTKEKSYTLVVKTPCHAGFKNEKHMVFPRNFSSVAGTLRIGASGYRRGAEVLFCDYSGNVYMLDSASKCTLWKEKRGDWTASDGECSIKKNADGVEVFAHGAPNGGEFVIEGEAILPRSSFPAEAVEGDFAAAKIARDAKAAK